MSLDSNISSPFLRNHKSDLPFFAMIWREHDLEISTTKHLIYLCDRHNQMAFLIRHAFTTMRFENDGLRVAREECCRLQHFPYSSIMIHPIL